MGLGFIQYNMLARINLVGAISNFVHLKLKQKRLEEGSVGKSYFSTPSLQLLMAKFNLGCTERKDMKTGYFIFKEAIVVFIVQPQTLKI